MSHDPKPGDPGPQRVVTVPRKGEVAEYTLSIHIVATAPAFDEKRMRKLIDDEFGKLSRMLNFSK